MAAVHRAGTDGFAQAPATARLEATAASATDAALGFFRAATWSTARSPKGLALAVAKTVWDTTRQVTRKRKDSTMTDEILARLDALEKENTRLRERLDPTPRPASAPHDYSAHLGAHLMPESVRREMAAVDTHGLAEQFRHGPARANSAIPDRDGSSPRPATGASGWYTPPPPPLPPGQDAIKRLTDAMMPHGPNSKAG
jgi:hypothetical protein